MVNDLDYADIKFPVYKKDYYKIEQNNSICINVFFYENGFAYPVHISDKTFDKCIDLLLIADENKLHYVYIEDFDRFMCNKTKSTNKKIFFRYYLHCYSSEKSFTRP